MTAPKVLTATEHRDVLLDLFTQVSQDAMLLDVKPVGVFVRTYMVDVHIGGEDVADVDRIGDAYSLPANEPDDEYANYDRQGSVEIAGHTVSLTVYCRKPRPVEVAR